MKIAVLCHRKSWYGGDLRRAAESRGHTIELAPFEALSAGVGISSAGVRSRELDLQSVQALIVRTMPPGSLEQVVFRMDVLARLQTAGMQILNPPKSLECAVDKYLTTSRLEQAGLPTPPTFVCEDAKSAAEAFQQLGGDVVVKPLFGSEGRGILRVSDPDLADRVFTALERVQAVLYLQKAVDHGGEDFRVLVLDGCVLGGMRRSHPTDFRTNVARSGHAETYEPTSQHREWALAATKATGARLAGVDILHDRSGAGYVIEVNAVPGWQAFTRVTGVDVATAVICALESPR